MGDWGVQGARNEGRIDYKDGRRDACDRDMMFVEDVRMQSNSFE